MNILLTGCQQYISSNTEKRLWKTLDNKWDTHGHLADITTSSQDALKGTTLIQRLHKLNIQNNACPIFILTNPVSLLTQDKLILVLNRTKGGSSGYLSPHSKVSSYTLPSNIVCN